MPSFVCPAFASRRSGGRTPGWCKPPLVATCCNATVYGRERARVVYAVVFGSLGLSVDCPSMASSQIKRLPSTKLLSPIFSLVLLYGPQGKGSPSSLEEFPEAPPHSELHALSCLYFGPPAVANSSSGGRGGNSISIQGGGAEAS